MKKIAIFVEGQTERIFIARFLAEYLGASKIEILMEKNLGKRGVKFLGKRQNPSAEFFILIYDVGGDGNVVSAVKERAEKINDIFKLFGDKYKKREKQAHTIAANIDYNFLTCSDEVRRKVDSFHYFTSCLDDCFS
ncbi:MAG: DUF4276 family protein [bacterium]|nr:DUF4276 family protein [bacterium]